jgi:hypothetical protein
MGIPGIQMKYLLPSRMVLVEAIAVLTNWPLAFRNLTVRMLPHFGPYLSGIRKTNNNATKFVTKCRWTG